MPDVAQTTNSQDLEFSVNTFDPASAQPDYPQLLLQKQKEMQSGLNQTLNRNLKTFQELEPELFQRIQNAGFTKQLQFLCTSNGVPNLFLIEQNRFLYPAFDPIEYCDKQVEVYLKNKPCRQTYFAEEKEQLGQVHFRYINELLRYQRANLQSQVTLEQTHACPCMIVLGVGLGFHISRLYESVEIGSLLIVEPDMDLFFASLFTFDWANLLTYIHNEPNREIKFFIGLNREQFKEQLEAYYVAGRSVLADFYWSIKHYSSPEINQAEAVTFEFFNRLNSGIGFFDSRLFALSQSIANVTQGAHYMRKLKYRGDLPQHILKLNHLTSSLKLPNDILNIPMCVVANGPSLSDDLPFLRKIQDHVLIIACGTALETLYNAGIQPHFYAAIERLKLISDVISLIPDPNYLQNITLLATDTIHPATVKLFKHQALLFKPNEPFLDILEYRKTQQYYDLEQVYCTNPLVGNMGLAAAATLGFKHIYMFGVDNGSARADKRQHPEESVTYSKIFSDTSHNVAQEDQDVNELTLERPGNFVEKVYTNLLYNSSAYTMEMLIKNNDDLQFFNCSNGCRLEGAKPTHSATLLEAFSKLPEVNLDKVIDSLQRLTTTLPLTKDACRDWCDKPLFNHIALSCLKLMGIITPENQDLDPNKLPAEQAAKQATGQVSGQVAGQAAEQAAWQASAEGAFTLDKVEPVFDCTLPQLNSRLDVMLILRKLQTYICDLEKTPRTKALISFFNGSITNFCTLTMRAMYLSTDDESALERARLHLKTIAFFLDDARRLYLQFAPDYCEFHHRDCLKGKIGFDHANDAAPDVPPYKQAVTQKDRDLYPVKVFKKRYE